MSMIAGCQLILINQLGTAQAFCDVLAGHFYVHAAGMGTFRLMNIEEMPYFGQNTIERSGLVSVGGFYSVSMHGVTGPDDFVPLLFRGAYQGG